MLSRRALLRRLSWLRSYTGYLRPATADYEQLQLTPEGTIHTTRKRRRPSSASCRPRFKWTYVLFALAAAFSIFILSILREGIPPNFDDIRKYERAFPQHNLSFAKEPGQGRYLRFPHHIKGHGLNNVLQEYLLCAYIAHKAGRALVFEDHVWSKLAIPYTIYDLSLRPARIPLNAFIAGPTAGGPISTGARTINSEFWEIVCPKESRRVMEVSDLPWVAEGNVTVKWWLDHLAQFQDPCLEVGSTGRPQVFSFELFGSPHILSIWKELSESPFLTQFEWSPLVLSAITRNFPTLFPSSLTARIPHEPIINTKGLVAIHLRRGDYKRHCERLANWKAEYLGLNQLPGIVDRFRPPQPPLSSSAPDPNIIHNVYPPPISHPRSINIHGQRYPQLSPPPDNQDHDGDANGEESDVPPIDMSQYERKKIAYYVQHCLPSVPQIVAKLHQVRLAHPSLSRVYILSNGWGYWLESVIKALKEDGWNAGTDGRDGAIMSSLDLTLDPEQKWVGMAVDMAIAERAEVFVGNGFSSLSSNIVMLRTIKPGHDMSTIHML